MSSSVSGVRADLSRVLIDASTIQERINHLASRVAEDFAGSTITVIAVMDGALFFVADLLRGLNLPVRLYTMSASSYHGGTQSCGNVKINWPPGLDVERQHVLVLDDILDTGLTLAAVRDGLLSRHPASLRLGVLLSKRRNRECDVKADYVGFEIEDEFVVGYGMDYNGRFRNLPCIGVLAPSGSAA